MGYVRLTQENRYQIQAWRERGDSCRSIAKRLGRSTSAITRELQRGSSSKGRYSPRNGQRVMEFYRYSSRRKFQKIQGRVAKYIARQIKKEDWSPEQIAHQIKIERKFKPVSISTIYRHIRRDKALGGKLWEHLRIKRKRWKYRKWPKGTRNTGLMIQNRTMISERPKIVDRRSRLGDFERDTVLGKRGGSVLLTIVDRKSRLLKLACVLENNADRIHEATVRLLRGEIVRTITNDNGAEFTRHQDTARELGAQIYFNNPHCSSERGTNENTNGLLRQYFARRQDIGKPHPATIKKIERKLNSRPRKCLGYKTPYEVHEKLKASVLR